MLAFNNMSEAPQETREKAALTLLKRRLFKTKRTPSAIPDELAAVRDQFSGDAPDSAIHEALDGLETILMGKGVQ